MVIKYFTIEVHEKPKIAASNMIIFQAVMFKNIPDEFDEKLYSRFRRVRSKALSPLSSQTGLSDSLDVSFFLMSKNLPVGGTPKAKSGCGLLVLAVLSILVEDKPFESELNFLKIVTTWRLAKAGFISVDWIAKLSIRMGASSQYTAPREEERCQFGGTRFARACAKLAIKLQFALTSSISSRLLLSQPSNHLSSLGVGFLASSFLSNQTTESDVTQESLLRFGMTVKVPRQVDQSLHCFVTPYLITYSQARYLACAAKTFPFPYLTPFALLITNILNNPDSELHLEQPDSRHSIYLSFGLSLAIPRRRDDHWNVFSLFSIGRAVFETADNYINDSKAYKTYLDFATRKATPKKARNFKKVASPSRKLSLFLEEELVEKPKRAKKPVKKSATIPTADGAIRDTLSESVPKKKTPAKVDRGKGIDLLSDVALLEAA
ncbi:hypothetical protein Tco_0348816 [Tanacetum coccineum]